MAFSNKERIYIVRDGVSMDFLMRLKELMAQRGVTKKELGEYIGVKPKTVQTYLSRKSTPSLGVLVKLAEFFHWDISDSVNYKLYHEGVTPEVLTRKRVPPQAIALDAVTMQFLSNLKQTIRARGMTQQQVADRVGVSRQSLTHYFLFHNAPSLETLFKLAEVLGCDLSQSENHKRYMEFLKERESQCGQDQKQK